MTELKHEKWAGITGGTPRMHRLLVGWLRHTSLYLPYWCMGWMIPFYMLFGRKGYLASYRFYRQRLGMNPLKSFFYSYLNHFRFGQIIIDRFAVYAGHRFRFDVDGQEKFDELEGGKEGFVQLSSHVGNYELAGYSLVPEHKSFNALVFAGEAATVMSLRSKEFSCHRVNMIPVSADMSHIFILGKALRTGNIVSISGDRIFGSLRSITCTFLGKQAKFPLGPFAIAVRCNVPMLAVFVMKTGTKSYRIHVCRLYGDDERALCLYFVTELEK